MHAIWINNKYRAYFFCHLKMRIQNRTNSPIYCQKQLINPGYYADVKFGQDETIFMSTGDRYIIIFSDLAYDLNMSTIVLVDDVQNGAKGRGINIPYESRNDYGVAYMDFWHTYFSIGSPLRRVQYDYLKINGTLTGQPVNRMKSLFWQCKSSP